MTARGMLLIACCSLPAHAAEPIPVDAAGAVFEQARTLCARDDGRLWGARLCAPIMLVDPVSRNLVANVGDADGVLVERDGVFVGRLPDDQVIANTAFDWSGTRWTQLIWPLPDDPGRRAVLVAHESFHNLQSALGFAAPRAGDNAHLDGRDGRYWLQLEWRALASALRATDERSRHDALADALAFRHRRWEASADAERNEVALELNEGLAEYTGVVVANDTDDARVGAALHDLQAHVADASFVRSFAYATGPAYGLLLDRYAPGWRSRLGADASLPALLAEAAGLDGAGQAARAQALAARYDQGGALAASEDAREQARLAQLARNRQRFVSGPVLRLALQQMRVQFDPRSLQPLDDLGTVYPQLRITDVWGQLQADDGALMTQDWSAVVVAAPVQGQAPVLSGQGWRLDLAPGWALVPGPRAGDFVLGKTAP